MKRVLLTTSAIVGLSSSAFAADPTAVSDQPYFHHSHPMTWSGSMSVSLTNLSTKDADEATLKSKKRDYIFGFIAGAISGIASIIMTQPVDVIKTRMQGLQAERYGHSLNCAIQLVREEGIQVFFHGMLARTLRSALGAGFAFTFFPIVKAMLLQEADNHQDNHHGHIVGGH